MNPILQYQITATPAEFDGFADKLGYMPEIFDLEGNVTPNTETKNDFIARRMKEVIDSLFFTPYVEDIEREVRTQRDADKEAMRNEIRSRSSVTFI